MRSSLTTQFASTVAFVAICLSTACSLVGNAVGAWKASADVVGSRIELPYRDIQQIELQHVSALKTTALVAAVALVATVAIITNNGTKRPRCCTTLASH